MEKMQWERGWIFLSSHPGHDVSFLVTIWVKLNDEAVELEQEKLFGDEASAKDYITHFVGQNSQGDVG